MSNSTKNSSQKTNSSKKIFKTREACVAANKEGIKNGTVVCTGSNIAGSSRAIKVSSTKSNRGGRKYKKRRTNKGKSRFKKRKTKRRKRRKTRRKRK